MTRRIAALLAVALAACASAPAREALLEISYVVDASHVERGKLSVVMTIAGNAADEAQVAIPAWAPGAYHIAEYSKNLSNVRASDPAGAILACSRVDDRTWKIKAGRAESFCVSYDIEKKDKDHAFLAGPATYLYVVGRKDAPCRVRFKIPEGWKVATGLDKDGDEYSARDYDTFIDCSTELGPFELLEFDQNGVKYQLVIHANGPVDGPKLVDMCSKIVKESNSIFGGAPFDRYVFFFHFRGGFGGGGLEHLNSTDISLAYAMIQGDPLTAASVTSHEYFHLWNVKRIRPFELGPFDYTQIVRSKALWQCEGVTSYYGDRALARCGIWSEERYLNHLATEIEILQNNPDRKVTSVEKASQSAWDRADWPRVDYYNKGELLGLLMDLKIRTMSEGRLCYDDVMRFLLKTYVKSGKGPIGIGFPEDGILKAINSVTGSNWTEFYDKYIRGLEELPYESILTEAGLSVDLRTVMTPDLGVGLRGTAVVHVPKDSPTGLKEGDRITAINGIEVTRANFRGELGKLKAGQPAKLKIGRGDKTEEVTLLVAEKERVTCKLKRSDAPSDLQKRIINGWLGK